MFGYSIMELEEEIAEEEKFIRLHGRKKDEASVIITAEARMIIEDYELAIDILKQVEGKIGGISAKNK